MLLIEQTLRGWSVSFRGLPLAMIDTKAGAIETANAHALDRFTVTGQPIGVFLRMSCGDEVLVGHHG